MNPRKITSKKRAPLAPPEPCSTCAESPTLAGLAEAVGTLSRAVKYLMAEALERAERDASPPLPTRRARLVPFPRVTT